MGDSVLVVAKAAAAVDGVTVDLPDLPDVGEVKAIALVAVGEEDDLLDFPPSLAVVVETTSLAATPKELASAMMFWQLLSSPALFVHVNSNASSPPVQL